MAWYPIDYLANNHPDLLAGYGYENGLNDHPDWTWMKDFSPLPYPFNYKYIPNYTLWLTFVPRYKYASGRTIKEYPFLCNGDAHSNTAEGFQHLDNLAYNAEFLTRFGISVIKRTIPVPQNTCNRQLSLILPERYPPSTLPLCHCCLNGTCHSEGGISNSRPSKKNQR